LTAYLAKNTGWSEKYILNLPFYKVLQLSHTFNILDGLDTRWAKSDSSLDKIDQNELDNLLEML
jgi:hypothetical protein